MRQHTSSITLSPPCGDRRWTVFKDAVQSSSAGWAVGADGYCSLDFLPIYVRRYTTMLCRRMAHGAVSCGVSDRRHSRNGMGANYLPRVARNVSLPGERHVASVLFYAEAAGNGLIATRGRRDERALQPRRHQLCNGQRHELKTDL